MGKLLVLSEKEYLYLESSFIIDIIFGIFKT